MLVAPEATRLTMIRGDVEYPLSDGTVLFDTDDGPVYLYYIADDGLGMASVTRFSERGPSQHGDTDLGFLLEPRIVSYIFAIYAPPTDDSRHLEVARKLLLRMFRPAASAATFRYDRASGDVMQIDGHFSGGMQFGSEDRQAGTWFQRFSVELKMSDPTWYDPDPVEITMTNSAWGTGFTVPTPVPTFVGSSAFDEQLEIVYTGSWDSYPRLRIYGPIRNPTISHIDLGLVLPFRVSINTTGYLDIDLASPTKTVTDEYGVSLMHTLGDPNNIDTFRLAADPDVIDGINTIRVVGSGTNAATKLVVTYSTRYVGL